MDITPADWEVIRRVLDASRASTLHCAVASVGDDGAPHVTPIGSVLLGEVGHAVYFENFAAAGVGRRVEHEARICLMAVDARRWPFLKALWRGKADRPVGVRLQGVAGARRPATPEEVARFRHRVRHLRLLRGHGLLWGGLRTVREVRFHAFEPVRLPPLGDPWPVAR